MLCSQQIIEAIKTLLLNGTDADNRVYADRLWPLDEGKLPAIRLYEQREQVTPQSIHWPVLEVHELDIAIELCASAANGIDATLAALKLQVLGRLFDTQPHATLGFTNVRVSHAGTGPMQPIETATSQLAQRTVQVTARFSAFAHQPETFV
jgi:hypothetical protein